jgi:hypothetical protein
VQLAGQRGAVVGAAADQPDPRGVVDQRGLAAQVGRDHVGGGLAGRPVGGARTRGARGADQAARGRRPGVGAALGARGGVQRAIELVAAGRAEAAHRGERPGDVRAARQWLGRGRPPGQRGERGERDERTERGACGARRPELPARGHSRPRWDR